jgi:hypothetical protein
VTEEQRRRCEEHLGATGRCPTVATDEDRLGRWFCPTHHTARETFREKKR